MRIMVIGYSGSGKSTLSKHLSNHYQIPILYIDTLQFEAKWVERNIELRNQDLLDFINNNDQWVIDGNYNRAHFDLRVSLADQIYILNYNRFTCFKNAVKRRIQYRNQSRESMTSGCPERLNLEFMWWLLHKGRSRRRGKLYHHLLKDYPNKVMMFKNRKQLSKHLKQEHSK